MKLRTILTILWSLFRENHKPAISFTHIIFYYILDFLGQTEKSKKLILIKGFRGSGPYQLLGLDPLIILHRFKWVFDGFETGLVSAHLDSKICVFHQKRMQNKIFRRSSHYRKIPLDL